MRMKQVPRPHHPSVLDGESGARRRWGHQGSPPLDAPSRYRPSSPAGRQPDALQGPHLIARFDGGRLSTSDSAELLRSASVVSPAPWGAGEPTSESGPMRFEKHHFPRQ